MHKKMNKHLDKAAVADVATQRKHYVPPQIEVVDLDNQASLLITSSASGRCVFGNGLSDDDFEE